MVKKTISTLAFCADRAFGVCTNKHDDYRPKDKYSTNFWRANSSATGSVPHHVDLAARAGRERRIPRIRRDRGSRGQM